MLLLLSIVTLGLLFYYFFVKPLKYWKKHGVPQNNPIPFFGDNFKPIMRIEGWTERLTSLYNIAPNARYVGVYLMNSPVLMLKDPDLIKQIAVKEFDRFLNHQQFVDADADPLWSKNLFALKNQPWKDMRNILSPSFTSSKMRTMFGLMTGAAQNVIEHFKGKGEGVIEVKMKDVYTRYSNDVIASAAFGINLNSLEHEDNEFYVMGKEVTNFEGVWTNVKMFLYFVAPAISKIFKLSLFGEKYRKYFTGLITDNIKAREERGIVRSDMIHLLLEARKGKSTEDKNINVDTGFATVHEISTTSSPIKQKIEISDEFIAAQAMIFFFAGFDTASSLMCFVSYELAVNPDIQERLREEVLSTLEENNGKITYETLLKMKYLDMVVSEALRKWPPALSTDRVCTKPYTIEPENSGEVPVNIKVGDAVWIPLYCIHHDPKYYPNPEKFDPERFSEENVKNIKPYTYMPFGVGPRNCIGSRFALLETKLIIFNILSNFEIVTTKQTAIPLKISKKTFNITDENRFPLGLKALNK